MYVATIPNRNSPPAILLRESYREGAKVKNRTLANLSHWPAHKIEALRAALRGDTAPIEWGHQIRSYVFQPYYMVKDHRTNAESGRRSKLLNPVGISPDLVSPGQRDLRSEVLVFMWISRRKKTARRRYIDSAR